MKSSRRRAKRAPKRVQAFLSPNHSPLKNHHHHRLLPPLADINVNVVEAERALGYIFTNPSLLNEALTHPSAVTPTSSSHQSLKFMGASALGMAFAKYMYITYPGLSPGDLSSLRSANVSTEKLARAAIRHDLYRFLNRTSQELDHNVQDFAHAVMTEGLDEESTMSYGGTFKKAPKVLADIVEAIAGAVYVDSGFDDLVVWEVFRQILAPIVTRETLDEQPVSNLYKHCQKQGMSVQFKNSKKGERNITKVFVDGKLVGNGSSEEKLIARLNAARDAMHNLSSSDEDDDQEEEEEGAKKRLGEFCSKSHSWSTPQYRVVKEEGPAHDKRFTCSIKVRNGEGKVVTAVGEARPRIKDAENAVAFKMLHKISK